jgi:hypothetical protein
MKKTTADDLALGDARLLAYIRRVNLDVMWSSEPSVVKAAWKNLEKGRKISAEFGLPPVDIPVGPWPVADTCGYQIAIEILRASQNPGRNAASYTQFDSVRKLRSAYLTAYESGPKRCLENTSFVTGRGQFSAMINSKTQSKLFIKFMKGCEKRMGRLVKQDLGISIEMLIGILNSYDDELVSETVSNVRKRFVVICASTFLILWVGALRGGEIFMLEISEFVKRRDDGRKSAMGHVVVPLMGRFKNKTGERNLVLVLANETNGGLKVRKWIDRFTALLKLEDRGSSTGPAICDEAGMVIERSVINDELHSALSILQTTTQVIPADIIVSEKFNIHRSFRRGATTRAKEQGVDEPTIELNNRWRKVQNCQGGLPNLPMSQLYVEITQALTSKLRFSKSL